jgi:hypothetical protein
MYPIWVMAFHSGGSVPLRWLSPLHLPTQGAEHESMDIWGQQQPVGMCHPVTSTVSGQTCRAAGGRASSCRRTAYMLTPDAQEGITGHGNGRGW